MRTEQKRACRRSTPAISQQPIRNYRASSPALVTFSISPALSIKVKKVMKTNINFLWILCFFLVSACRNGNASGQSLSEPSKDTLSSFTLPSIPSIIIAPEQRTEFLAKHYWDNVNFADTSYIHHPEVTEQAWANYCGILNSIPLETAQEAIRNTIDRTNADKKVFIYMTDLADKYLYNPNSPMRNEELYIPVLEAMAVSPVLEEIEKVRPKARLELANKNRIGTKALNFTYTLPSGVQGTLYQLQADYILVFINNPGCHACHGNNRCFKTRSHHRATSEREKANRAFFLS